MTVARRRTTVCPLNDLDLSPGSILRHALCVLANRRCQGKPRIVNLDGIIHDALK